METNYTIKRTKSKKPESIANSEKNYYEQNNNKNQEFDYNSEPIYSSNKQKPKAIITLNIGESLEHIKIFENQDLYEIACEIANKHDLNEEFIDFLVNNIQSQLNEHEKKPSKSFLSNFDQNKIKENEKTIEKRLVVRIFGISWIIGYSRDSDSRLA